MKDFDDDIQKTIKWSGDANIAIVREYFSICNRTQDELNSALNVAVESQQKECVKVLIEKGADVDSIQKYDTPLALAAKYGHLEIVRLLLNAGADVNKHNKNAHTAVVWATFFGHTEIVEVLLQKKADPNVLDSTLNKPPITLASTYGYLEIAKLLIDAHCVLKGHESPPLHEAIGNNYIDIVKLLIRSGIDLNEVDHTGNTGLHRAVSNKDRKVVINLLKDNGADLNAVDRQLGCTPLALAVRCGRYDNIETLIQAGCDVNMGESSLVSPLYLSISKNDVRSCEMLINAGANVNQTVEDGSAQDVIGLTPLAQAIHNKCDDIAYLLIKSNCIINSKFSREHPLFIALTNSNFVLASDLILAGADLNYLRKWLETETDVYDETLKSFTHVAKGPQPLVSLARNVVKQCIGYGPKFSKDLNTLPLPSIVKDYISLKDIYTF